MNRKLQVFVSSTYLDLVAERQAAVEAILGAGHIPAGMELFAAGNEGQLNVVKRWIEASDVLILMFGARYGSIEHNSGLSYTHLEYRHAIEMGIPTICMMLSESFLIQKLRSETWISETDVGGYIAFRSEAATKLWVEVLDLNHLKLEITRSLHELNEQPGLIGWIRPTDLGLDPKLVGELNALKGENSDLRARIQTMMEIAPQDVAVEDAIKLLRSWGFTAPSKIKGESGEFIHMDRWLLGIADLLSKWPHKVSMGSGMYFQTVAPTFVTYGLMKEIEEEHEPFMRGQPKIKTMGYVLTDLGTRVVTRLRTGSTR
jgi:Domain of unknown function (DUF4062)